MIGTVISLIITTVIASSTVKSFGLTGLNSEEASFLQVSDKNTIDLVGLVLAGIIIGLIGILNDITISQAAVVTQLKAANSQMNVLTLYKRAMDVGRDHIASMINTLILVYAGSSLPLLLIFIGNPHPFSEIVNYEFIASEIAKTLVGSLGLILAVPITTIIAAIAVNM